VVAIYDRMNDARKLSAIAASAKHHVTPAAAELCPDAARTVPLVHFVQAFSKAAFRYNHFDPVREASFN